MRENVDQIYNGSDSSILQFIHQLPYIMVVIMVVIFTPIIEEVIFRIWTKRKLKYDIISFVFITGNIYFVFALPLLFSIIASLVLFYLFFFMKNRDSLKIILLSIVTSLLFGLSHVGNEIGFWPKCAYVCSASGMGFVFAWIGLRYKFVYCIIAHGLYNLLVTIIILGVPTWNTQTFRGDSYKAEISNDMFSSGMVKVFCDEDSIQLYGSLPKIASDLAASIGETDSDTIYFGYMKNDLKRYKFVVHPNSVKEKIDRRLLLSDFITQTKLNTDTVVEKAYILRIKDTCLLRANKSDWSGYEIEYLIENCRETHRLPLLYDKSYNDKCI